MEFRGTVNIETVTISYALHYRARLRANSPIVYMLTIQIRRNVNIYIFSFQWIFGFGILFIDIHVYSKLNDEVGEV